MRTLQTLLEGILDTNLADHEFANKASKVIKDFNINGECTCAPSFLKRMNTWIDVPKTPINPLFNNKRYDYMRKPGWFTWNSVFEFWSWVLEQPMSWFEGKNGGSELTERFKNECLTKRGAKYDWRIITFPGPNLRSFKDNDHGIRVQLSVYNGGEWKRIMEVTIYKTKHPLYTPGGDYMEQYPGA